MLLRKCPKRDGLTKLSKQQVFKVALALSWVVQSYGWLVRLGISRREDLPTIIFVNKDRISATLGDSFLSSNKLCILLDKSFKHVLQQSLTLLRSNKFDIFLCTNYKKVKFIIVSKYLSIIIFFTLLSVCGF